MSTNRVAGAAFPWASNTETVYLVPTWCFAFPHRRIVEDESRELSRRAAVHYGTSAPVSPGMAARAWRWERLAHFGDQACPSTRIKIQAVQTSLPSIKSAFSTPPPPDPRLNNSFFLTRRKTLIHHHGRRRAGTFFTSPASGVTPPFRLAAALCVQASRRPQCALPARC